MKKLTLAAVALACSLGVSAAPISPEVALQRLNNGPQKARAIANSSLNLAYTAKTESGQSAAYVFTPADGKGFAILSADDLAVPVFGYSDSEVFDVNNIPDALRWWLNQLASRVEFAKQNGVRQSAGNAYAPVGMTAIGPLVKTKWDQGAPYNNQTPEINGKHTYTGCVATSFAQAMKYFNYPQRGKGNITYYDSGTRRVLNFTKDFQWAQMLDTYTAGNYTEEQADAVAFLMKACGFSVEMGYGLNASGAVSYKLANAAITYFGYDEATRYTEREYYTLDEWSRMVYDNIKNIGPVIYDGREMAGGHSFICDGYDGNGYFHFNWGWGGMSDGYYVLDALNPESQGIGASEGGFNYSQGILLGLQPKTPDSHYPFARLKVYGSVTGKLANDVDIVFGAVGEPYKGWGNASYRSINCNVGAIITSADGGSYYQEVPGVFSFTNGTVNTVVSLSGATSYWSTETANPAVSIPPTLPDGKYKVTVASKDSEQADAPWQPMLVDLGSPNYCYLEVNNGNYTVTTASPVYISFDNAEFTSPLYSGRNCRFEVEASNSSDLQLSQSYYPALYRDGGVQYVGDYMLLTVDPGQTAKVQSFTRFSVANGATSTGYGTYQLAMVDAVSGRIIGLYGEYDLTYVNGSLKIQLNDFSIEDAPQQTVTSGSRTFNDAYIINNADEIEINIDYTVTQGYFDSSLRIIGAMYDPQTGKFVNFDGDVYSEYPFTGQGSDNSLTVPMKTADLEVGKVYRLTSGYVEGGSNKSLGTIYFQFNSSGVEGIEIDDEEGSSIYYNLQGIKVENPSKGQMLIRKTGSKTAKIIF